MGGTPYPVTNVKLDVSVNGGQWMLDHGFDNLNGTWDLSGLTLNTGENTIKVRLTVSDEVKTTDGLAAVAYDNDFQTFTVNVATP